MLAGCGSAQLLHFELFSQLLPWYVWAQFIQIAVSDLHLSELCPHFWHLKHRLARGMNSRTLTRRQPMVTNSGTVRVSKVKINTVFGFLVLRMVFISITFDLESSSSRVGLEYFW